MSRCKACDKVMTEVEVMRIDPMTEDYTDLCGHCMAHSESYRLDYELDEGTIDGIEDVIL